MGNVGNCQATCRNDCKEWQQYCERDVEENKARHLEEVDLSGLVHVNKAMQDTNVPQDLQQGMPAANREAAAPDLVPSGPGKRPPFVVELVRQGKHWRTLGLLVSPDDDPRFLIIDDVWEPTLISEWNAAQAEHMRVRPGDIITAVNEVVCNADEMLSHIQALGQGSTLKLQISSP